MSVPLGKRGHNKLEVITNARLLCSHTLSCTANKRVFLPEYQHSLTDIIEDDARQIYLLCWRANCLRDMDKRKELQKEALWKCEELCALLSLAQQLLKFRSRRLEYWVELVDKEEMLIRGWIKIGQNTTCPFA